MMVLEKTLESPLDCKEVKPVNPKGNQPWTFIGRTETAILWPPDAKSQLFGKDPDVGKDWRQEEKWAAEDEMVRDSITDYTDMNLSKFWEVVEDRGAQHASVHGVAESWTQLSYWTTALDSTGYFTLHLVITCASRSLVSDSLWPHGLYSPWNSPGQNNEVSSCSYLQRIFPTQGLNPGLPHYRWFFTNWAIREGPDYYR